MQIQSVYDVNTLTYTLLTCLWTRDIQNYLSVVSIKLFQKITQKSKYTLPF